MNSDLKDIIDSLDDLHRPDIRLSKKIEHYSKTDYENDFQRLDAIIKNPDVSFKEHDSAVKAMNALHDRSPVYGFDKTWIVVEWHENKYSGFLELHKSIDSHIRRISKSFQQTEHAVLKAVRSHVINLLKDFKTLPPPSLEEQILEYGVTSPENKMQKIRINSIFEYSKVKTAGIDDYTAKRKLSYYFSYVERKYKSLIQEIDDLLKGPDQEERRLLGLESANQERWKDFDDHRDELEEKITTELRRYFDSDTDITSFVEFLGTGEASSIIRFIGNQRDLRAMMMGVWDNPNNTFARNSNSLKGMYHQFKGKLLIKKGNEFDAPNWDKLKNNGNPDEIKARPIYKNFTDI